MSIQGSVSEARATVRGLIDALNGGSAPDAALERYSRSDALTKKVLAYRADYPSFMIHLLDMFEDRDLVVIRFVLDLEGRARVARGATEAPPEPLEAIAVCRVGNGAITELWLEMDLFAQVLAVNGEAGEHVATAAAHSDPGADTKASRSLVMRYLAALNNQRKTPALIDRFASDPALLAHIMAFESGFPGYNLLADEVIADGDRVAVRFHTRQRHANEFMGIPATGLELSITGIIIYRIEDGKIADHWLQADTWTLMQRLQAGAQPLTKREFIDRRMRGGEYGGAERRASLRQ